MIKFKFPSSAVCTAHLNHQKKKIINIIDVSGYSASVLTGYADADDIVNILKAELDDVLIGSPKKLDAIVTKIDAGFPAFALHCQVGPKNTKHVNYNAEAEALRKHLREIFNYDSFSQNTTKGAYWLVKSYNRRICPYCQLHHINYHYSNSKSFKLRPPLDHFYPRSRYPYLGVSISNLIPACAQCNSGVKLDRDPRATNVPHPLMGNPTVKVKFDFTLNTSQLRIKSEKDVDVKLGSTDTPTQAHLDFFQLKERYKWYKPEIIDLFFRNTRYYQYHSELRAAIPREEFLLGFDKKNVSERVLGNCLAALVDWLPEAKPKNST